MTGWRLLLTRPAEESVALAAALSDVGIYSSSLPLLDIEPLPVSPERQAVLRDLGRYCAVIVVSKPAARLALQHLDRQWPQVQWFSVGAATAQVLAERGYRVDYPQTGDDSEALLQLPALREAIARPDARVLIVRGEGGRELLAQQLRARGVSVDYLELYRRLLPEYDVGELTRRIQLERLNGVVVSSGQGFLHLQALAGADWPQVAQLPLFVPSPRVQQMAQAAGAEKVVDCRGASAAALLVALRGIVL
ncbi:uroporphyrinogen-III synthase [Pseudomonas sp. lyk4-R2A-8]|uniref:uroporphyrinogen-III synthase n=1 Tax=Pseudomonas sp. lyk4-R2A-8 TaxID=3040316 RepID=UPI002552B5D8|nr:uroporphyrinogen-III synthase [Pseudomonas sp. lyk4-R2A-8]